MRWTSISTAVFGGGACLLLALSLSCDSGGGGGSGGGNGDGSASPSEASFNGGFSGPITVSQGGETSRDVISIELTGGSRLEGTFVTGEATTGTISGEATGNLASFTARFSGDCPGTASGSMELVTDELLLLDADGSDCEGPFVLTGELERQALTSPPIQGAALFRESWESSPAFAYVPSDLTRLVGDAGVWLVGDTVSEFPDCGRTPHRAEVVEGGDQFLRLTSARSVSSCADNIWVVLSEVPSLRLNPGFSVPIAPDTWISFEATGHLEAPSRGFHTEIVLPSGDTISLLLEDDRGNVLAYLLDRAAERTPNELHDNYREIFLDPAAGDYSRDVWRDFMTIPEFGSAANARIVAIEFGVNEHGFGTIDNLTIDRR